MREEDIIIRLITEGEKEVEKLGKGVSILNTEIRKTGNTMTTYTTNVKKLATGQTQVTASIKKTTMAFKRFHMEYLSFMFFGMQMQKRIQRVMMGSISAFMEISGSANKSAQTIAILNAQFKYLQFTIGSVIAEALEPFLPIIIGIIDKLVDFIEQHPDEVFWALATAFGVFGTLAIGGSLMLFLQSLGMFMENHPNAPSFWGKMSESLDKLAGVVAIGLGAEFAFEGLSEGGIDWRNFLSSALLAWGLKRFVLKDVGLIKLFGWILAVELLIEFLLHPKETTRWVGKLVGIIGAIVLNALDILKKVFETAIDLPSIIFGDFEGFKKRMEERFKDIGSGLGNEFKKGIKEGIETVGGYTLEFAKEQQGELGWELFGMTDEEINNYLNNLTAAKTEVETIGFSWDLFKQKQQEALNPFAFEQYNKSLERTGFLIGSETKGSFPLVWAVLHFKDTLNKSLPQILEAIQQIISKLNQIPREIHTYHYIHTINVGSGGGGGKASGGFQFGGFVPAEGLYRLHGGEYVFNPWGGVHIAGMSINVNAHTNASADEIAEIVANKFYEQIERFR